MKRKDWEDRANDIEDDNGRDLCQEILKDLLDEIELQVNKAKDLIESAKIGHMSNVDDAYDVLKDLSSDLY